MPQPDKPSAPDNTPTKPARKMFTSRAATPLPADQAERQSGITMQAVNLIGLDRAIAFLNFHSDALGGQPLEIATKSAIGYDEVEHELNFQAAEN